VNGFVLGTLGLATEEWWGYLMRYLGDPSYDYLHGGYTTRQQQAYGSGGGQGGRPHSY
jgi:hypothetical protein